MFVCDVRVFVLISVSLIIVYLGFVRLLGLLT